MLIIVRNPDQTIQYIEGSMLDITGQKEAEKRTPAE